MHLFILTDNFAYSQAHRPIVSFRRILTMSYCIHQQSGWPEKLWSLKCEAAVLLEAQQSIDDLNSDKRKTKKSLTVTVSFSIAWA